MNSPNNEGATLHSDSLTWTFNGQSANLYLWPAKTMHDAASGYVKLTGKPKLPPRWAFGYLQSQWGWADSAYIASTLDKFRSHKLPVDAFIFDFEWYTGTPDYAVKKEGMVDFSDFNFNPRLFPHPAEQIASFRKQGVKFIGIRKPRIGSNLLLDTARTNSWLISPTTDNRDLNFSNAALRKWYQQSNRPLLDAGVDAWWDDEGESYYTCYYWWNLAQRDLLAATRPHARHFTLNRAFSPGNQRFGYCTWNGDITATWGFLNEVPQDLLNFSLAGMYYGACDIGGFHGTPTKEMLVRWFQAGVFIPIMRAHSDIGTTAHFPFLWGDDGEAAMRKALDLRYQLLPYIYSLGHEAYQTGAPIMRPLVMEFPNDTSVANLRNEWLVGKGLLAAPVLDSGGSRRIYLPADKWYDFSTGEVHVGPINFTVTKALDEIPVFVRAGTILPLGPVIQYSEQRSDIPLEIRIYPGKNGTFDLVEDDGVSDGYTNKITRTTSFAWNEASKTLTWKVSGSYNGELAYRNIRIVLAGAGVQAGRSKDSKVTVIGKGGRVSFN